MRTFLVVALALLPSCIPNVHNRDQVERDAKKHLVERYGEPFTITRVVNHSRLGEGIVDTHNFVAHPTRDSSQSFQGMVDYETTPPRITDPYACVQLKQWLPDAIIEAVGPRYRIEHAGLRCNERMPANLRRGTRLPDGMVELRIELEAYGEGDPLQVVSEAREAYLKAGETLGFRARGDVYAYPSTIWPFARTFDPPDDYMKHGRPDDWRTLRLARARADGRPAEAYVRIESMEVAAKAVLADKVPDAMSSVYARRGEPGPQAPTEGPLDVRVAVPGMDEAQATELHLALLAALPSANFHLMAIDTSEPGGTQREAYDCRGSARRCHPVGQPVLGPEWQALR